MPPSGSDDAPFEAAVQALTQDARAELRRVLDALDRCHGFVEMRRFLQVSYVPEVGSLLRWCSENRILVPFDWGTWDEGRDLTPEAIAQRPVADAVRLLTAVIRSDRFSAGALGAALDAGTIQACLRRILAA